MSAPIQTLPSTNGWKPKNMSDDKKRNMSAKGFLHKAGTKAANSAAAFIATHRQWLETGEVAEVTSPILAKLDKAEILPTPALIEIKNAVLGHMIASDALKAEKAMEKAQDRGSEKNHIGTIFDANGMIVTRIKEDGDEEELIKGFDMPQDAQRWVDRRLFDLQPGCYGIVVHTQTNQETLTLRDDSIARILKTPKGPAIKAQKKSTPRLGFGVKAKQDTASFSHG